MIEDFKNKPGFLAALESYLAAEFGSIHGLVEITTYGLDGNVKGFYVGRATDNVARAVTEMEEITRIVDIDAFLDLTDDFVLDKDSLWDLSQSVLKTQR